MIKPVLILLFGILSNVSNGQTFCLGKIQLPAIKEKKISNRKKINFVIDSLRNQIFADTSKFDIKDLLISGLSNQTENITHYSLLYVVENYSYKLDIIDKKLVEEFVNEMLVSDKIKRIYIIEKDEGEKLGQKTAIIYIDLKKNAKVNFNVAGLNDTEKHRILNNFRQLKNDKFRLD